MAADDSISENGFVWCICDCSFMCLSASQSGFSGLARLYCTCWQQWALFQQSTQITVCMTLHQTRHLLLWNVMTDRHIKIPTSRCPQI